MLNEFCDYSIICFNIFENLHCDLLEIISWMIEEDKQKNINLYSLICFFKAVYIF